MIKITEDQPTEKTVTQEATVLETKMTVERNENPPTKKSNKSTIIWIVVAILFIFFIMIAYNYYQNRGNGATDNKA